MSTLGLTKETATKNVEVFQLIMETAQGGFTLDETVLAAGATVRAGTVIGFDEATRKAKVGKIGVLQAAALNTATTYRVLKGHNLAVGMTVNLAGGTARALTAVNTADPNYDEFTVGTTIGVAAAAGDSLFVVDDGFNKAKGLLMEDLLIPASGLVETLSVVIRGTVYERRIPPVAAAVKALMPNIIFSQSF